jgi:hypothetical protein
LARKLKKLDLTLSTAPCQGSDASCYRQKTFAAIALKGLGDVRPACSTQWAKGRGLLQAARLVTAKRLTTKQLSAD